MVSGGQIFLLVTAAFVMIKPRDIPKIANAVGYSIGRTLRFVRDSKNSVNTFVEGTQLSELHADLRRELDEFNLLKQELRKELSTANEMTATVRYVPDIHERRKKEGQLGQEERPEPARQPETLRAPEAATIPSSQATFAPPHLGTSTSSGGRTHPTSSSNSISSGVGLALQNDEFWGNVVATNNASSPPSTDETAATAAKRILPDVAATNTGPYVMPAIADLPIGLQVRTSNYVPNGNARTERMVGGADILDEAIIDQYLAKAGDLRGRSAGETSGSE